MREQDKAAFARKAIGRTPAGMRLRLAFEEGRIAQREIALLLLALKAPVFKPVFKATGVGSKPNASRASAQPPPRSRLETLKALDTWRRAYVKCCERASEALTDLQRDHDWPPEAGHDPNYHWRPNISGR